MSVSVMALVWGSTIRDRTQVDVLNYLANCGDDYGGNCFPGIPRVARFARCSQRTVIRAIAQLEELGFISVIRGDGRGNLSEFQINLQKLKECQDVTLSPRRKRVTPATGKGDAETRKGDKGDNPPDPLLGRTVKEPSGNRNPVVPIAIATGTVESAVDQVCSALAIANRRKRKLIRRAIELEAEKGQPPPTTALTMIAAWREQGERHSREELKYQYGMDKFFGLGIWKDQNTWPWDNERMRLRAEARVGSSCESLW